MEMRLLLVESDAQIRGDLWSLLTLYRVFHLEGAVDTVEQAMHYMEEHPVDVIFTNRQPADPRVTSDGGYLGIVLSQRRPDVQVVVYGKDKQDAYYACRAQCAGFLLYPFDPLDIQILVNRLTYIHDLQKIKRETAERSIMVKTRSGYRLARLKDILFVEHINRINRFITEGGQEIEVIDYTMNALEKLLEPRGFFRCHQSFIVNLSKVSAIHVDNEKYAIAFDHLDGRIMVSREKYAVLVSLLKERFDRISD